MLFILLLALILFGPKRLPEIAREVGKFMAEFKRASNDFKYQLQAEIDKASAPAAPSAAGQQSSSSSPTLLLPAELPAAPPAASPERAEAESEHERLMRTARMAYEAQTFSLRPPEPPPAQSSLPFVPEGSNAEGQNAESRPTSPAEDFAAQPPDAPPSTANQAANPAHESGNSAPLQNS